MKLKLLDPGTRIFPTYEAANAIVIAAIEAEDDWTYTVVPSGNPKIGGFIVQIYDEDGEFVHNFS